MSKYFIEDQQEVSDILATLKPTGKKSGYYTEVFVDPNTGNEWEKYLFELNDNHDEGIGLRKLPHLPTKEVIEIALTTKHDDEADGAAEFLLEDEKENEFRELLVCRLEQAIDTISPQRFEIIYHRAELYDKTNKRAIIGKSSSETNKDYEHFLNLANRANALRSKLVG